MDKKKYFKFFNVNCACEYFPEIFSFQRIFLYKDKILTQL